MSRLLAIMGACAIAVATAASAITAAPAGLAAYFPLTPGMTWVYRSSTSGEVTMRVGATRTVGSAPCRLIDTIIGGSVRRSECYQVTPNAVYTLLRMAGARAVTLEPPQRLLATPITVGGQWQWVGRLNDQPVTFDYLWARREKVGTPAGTFDTMQLYFTGTLGPQVYIQSWRWFGRDVGLVKEDTLLVQGAQQAREYLELVRLIRPK